MIFKKKDNTHWLKCIFHWWSLRYYNKAYGRDCLDQCILSLATSVEMRDIITTTFLHFGKYNTGGYEFKKKIQISSSILLAE